MQNLVNHKKIKSTTSWIRRIWLKIRILLSSKQVNDKLNEIEDIVYKKYIDVPQADITLKKSEAVAKLIESVKDIDSFASRIEDLLVIKVKGNKGESKIIVLSLNRKDMNILKENPNLFYNPTKLLSMFSKLQKRIT